MPALSPGFLARPVAHRGLHDRANGVIENTLSVVRAAAEAGYGIEIDVQPAADGTPMVFHDEKLDRLTAQTGLIRDQSVEVLTATPLKGTTDTIPTLAAVLDAVAGRVPLVVEVKDQDGALGPDIGPLEDRVAALLAAYTGPVAVMSFNPHSVAALARAAPTVPRGWTTDAFAQGDWPDVPADRLAAFAALDGLTDLDCAFISHDHRALDTAPVHHARTTGHAILCWTVRNPQAEQAARQHADQITFEGYMPDG